jgi:flagellar motor switch protein FliG
MTSRISRSSSSSRTNRRGPVGHLRFLDPRKASAVVSFLSPDVRKEVLLRMARMDRIDPLVFSKMEEVLKERLRTQGTIVTEQIDGATALADILKHMDLAAEERILKEMSDADAVLSEQVKEKLFTIDVIFSIDDTDLRTSSGLQRSGDRGPHQGKAGSVRERFLSCVSQREGTSSSRNPRISVP